MRRGRRSLIAPGRELHSEFVAVSCMIMRCTNTAKPEYLYYGASGITVCSGLTPASRGCQQLIAVIGARPSPAHSVDRTRVNDGYWCGRCEECERLGRALNLRWATMTEQARNRRNTRRITFNGEALTTGEWSERTGIAASLIAERIRDGKTPAEALTPVGPLVRHPCVDRRLRFGASCRRCKLLAKGCAP